MEEKYKKAGQILSKIRKKVFKLVREDLPVIELVNFVEDNIRKEGAKPAFPCNVSINDITAHYTSPANDKTLIRYGDLVKLDMGAHVDGYIADTAITILVGDQENEVFEKNLKMIEASQNALENAISIIKAGVELGKIGKIIQDTINDFGFKPVTNLTGHSMDRWILHSGLSVPNVNEKNTHKLREGDVLAIEPFATDGIGYVTDMPPAYIFRFLRDRPLRLVHARKVLKKIKEEYKSLPFAQRWLAEHFDAKRLNASMRLLIQSRAIYPYHVLREKSGAWVSQAEHTIIVEKDSCQVITE
ncbi:MAG TPA: type II methionyl aminopeptidase [Methanobacteriales archaeon]|nr:MAG: Methionine aminopeptidase [Methanobacteriaceae archaeon 41_258]MBC7088894.1 type II methionyl aminopeptidase [Methanobacteriaceae archaeon]MBC7096926.1 type II methionyl aminopeptidase [Methanobacteriales archaeon]HIH62556.1 type II methionyl aminopeptidase [Methanobacteriales archaeon]